MTPNTAFPPLWGYTDPKGHPITVRPLPLTSPHTEREKALFISSFVETYKALSPNEINANCKTRYDLIRWLDGMFDAEWTSYQTLPGLTNLGLFRNETLVAFAIFYPWRDETETLYLRLFSISPEAQKQGYGSALLETIKSKLGFPVSRLIADTRYIYAGARAFYKKCDFSEGAPHDENLDRDCYLGLEWISRPIAL